MITLLDKISFLVQKDPELYRALQAIIIQVSAINGTISSLDKRATLLEQYSSGVRVYSNVDQAIAAGGGFTAITFDTVEFDLNHYWNNAQKSRLTVHEAGLYIVGADVFMDAGATQYNMRLRATNVVRGTINTAQRQFDTAAFATILSMFTLWKMFPDDYVEIELNHNAGGPISSVHNVPSLPIFYLYRLPLNPQQQVFF